MFASSTLGLLLAAITGSIAAPTSSAPETYVTLKAPIYYLSNCYSIPSSPQDEAKFYGAIGYYSHLETMPHTPDQFSVLSVGNTIDYEDGTWVANWPFSMTVVIHADAYTAQPGTLVGEAQLEGSSKKLNCYRITRQIVWFPTDLGPTGTCSADYVCF
ncbi:unnamed protein product [Discula destructiva]